MDDVLVAQFERVEKALGTLVDSIAAFNPSPQAALDLVAADDELSQGLDQLAKHQANNARIHVLRAEADALEEQLKSSVEKLATLRHELFETPATTFPANSRPVPFDELLQYANHISKHTVPPTYRERVPDAATDKDKEKGDTGGSSGAPTNGVNTPANNQPEAIEPLPPPPPSKDTPQNPDDVENAANATTVPELTAEEAEWLKELHNSQIAWYPWPSTDKIRAGNLYKLQYYREKHHDLEVFDIPAHEEAERLKHMGGEEDALKAEGQEVPGAEQQQQPSSVPRIPRPKQEAFTLFDDMDDE